MNIKLVLTSMLAIAINSMVASATALLLVAVTKNLFYIEDGMGPFTFVLFVIILLLSLISCYFCHFYIVKPLLIDKQKEK